MADARLSARMFEDAPSCSRIVKRRSTGCPCTPTTELPGRHRERLRRSSAPPAAGRCADAGGCAVGPTSRRRRPPVPEKWRGAGDPRITTQTAADSLWWKAFNDPALDRLVELAYRQNLPLQIAGLRIVEARAQFGVATGRQFPQTQVAVRQRRRRSGSPSRSPATPASTATCSTIRSASTPPGSWTSGASTGAAWRRKAPTCSRRWPTTTPRSSRSPRRSRGPTSRSGPSRC